MFPHRIVASVPHLMPIIPENEGVASPSPPTVPPRSYRRAGGAAEHHHPWFASNNYVDFEPREQYQVSPVYVPSDRGIMDKQQHVAGPSDCDDNPRRVRFLERWGWKKLASAVVSFLFLLLVLGLGLGLGLKQTAAAANQQGSGNSSGSPSPAKPLPAPVPSSSPSPQPSPATPRPRRFPAGTYNFTAALMSVQNSCTADPAVFGCYPFTTYSTSTVSQSAASFEWTIEPSATAATGNGSSHYQISSSVASGSGGGRSAPQFTNLTMDLIEGDTPTERYTFSLTMALGYVIPNGTATLIPGVSTCWYNSTVVKVELWTRRRATYPPGIADVPLPTDGTGSSSSAIAPWPFRFTMDEVQSRGPSVPTCFDDRGAVLGPAIDGAGDCRCSYSNFRNDGAESGNVG